MPNAKLLEIDERVHPIQSTSMSDRGDFFGQIEQLGQLNSANPGCALSNLVRTRSDAEMVFMKVAQLVEQCVGGVSHIDRKVAGEMRFDKVEGVEVDEGLTLDQRIDYLKSCWVLAWNTLETWGARDEPGDLSRAGTWGCLSSLEEYIRRLCVRYSDGEGARKPYRDLAIALTLFEAFRKAWPGGKEVLVLPRDPEDLPITKN